MHGTFVSCLGRGWRLWYTVSRLAEYTGPVIVRHPCSHKDVSPVRTSLAEPLLEGSEAPVGKLENCELHSGAFTSARLVLEKRKRGGFERGQREQRLLRGESIAHFLRYQGRHLHRAPQSSVKRGSRPQPQR